MDHSTVTLFGSGISIARSVQPARLTVGVMSGLISGARALYIGGRGRIPGTVKERGTPNVPMRRKVRLIRDRDALLVGETWSDAATGEYVFEYIDPAYDYTVLSYDHTGKYLPASADRIVTEIMP